MAYPIVYPQTLTLYDVDDYIVQANPNDTYTFGFNTFLDALDGVSSTFLFSLTLTSAISVPSRRVKRSFSCLL